MRIEAHIPPPPEINGRPERCKYPWNRMEIGESFFVRARDDRRKHLSSSLYNAGMSWCKKNRPDLRVVTRSRRGGVRVWLVKAK